PVPPNVHKVYSTPSASLPFTSLVSRVTITRALPARSIGGGTSGGDVSTAFHSGRESPRPAFCSPRPPPPRAAAPPPAPTPAPRPPHDYHCHCHRRDHPRSSHGAPPCALHC